MTKAGRRTTAALVAALVMMVAGRASANDDEAIAATDQPGEVPRAEPLEPLTIEVVTVNQARIPRETVKRAEEVATRIFLAAGIRLEWTNTAPDSVEPYRETAQQLKIHIVPDSPMKQAGRRLGVAERLVDNSDRRAFVFYNRIVDLARLNGADIAPILGHALAHEMGHVLLPYGSHTSQGIMREEWDRAQFEAMAKGLLTFTAQHTDLIRTQVRAMHAAVTASTPLSVRTLADPTGPR